MPSPRRRCRSRAPRLARKGGNIPPMSQRVSWIARVEAHDRLGFVLGAQGRTDEAIAEFEQAIAIRPSFFDAQYHLGATLWWTKQVDRARVVLGRAVTLRPTHAEARYYLALVQRQQGDVRAAIRDLRIALRYAPTLAPAHTQLGAALQASGDVDGAVDEFRRALGIDPTLSDAGNSLGLALMQRGDADEAMQALRAVIDRHPDHTAARLNLGTALMQKGDLAAATSEYRELTRRDPANAEAFYDLGLALKQQDDFEEAERALRTAVRLDPALPEAPYTLGVVLWQTGRGDEAVALFRDALARRSQYAEAHYMLGTISRQRGDLDEALAEFRETIRMNPASAEAQTSLAQALQARHDPAGASAAFAEAGEAQFLVYQRRARRRPGRRHGLWRRHLEQVPARNDRHRRGGVRLRQRRLARSVFRERFDPRRISAGPGADQSSLPEQARRHVRGRHDESRACRERLGTGRLRRRLRQRRLRRSVRQLLGTEPLVSQPGERYVRRRHAQRGTHADAYAVGNRLRVPRLRPRRPARSVRRQLHRPGSRHRADARVGPVPLQRHQGRVRPAGGDGREERAVPQPRKRHVPGCVGARGHDAGEGHVRTRREHDRLRQRWLGRFVRGERLEPQRVVPQQP